VRLHNTLLGLVRDGRIARERFEDVYLYVSADPQRAKGQIDKRRELLALISEVSRVASDEEIVEVLVEALRAAPEIPPPDEVARRLMTRGGRLEPHHVLQVFEAHDLEPGKKRGRFGSRRSRHRDARLPRAGSCGIGPVSATSDHNSLALSRKPG
jgi:DNA polymerase II large subunit